MIKGIVLEGYGVPISVLRPISKMLFGCAEQEIIRVSGMVYEGSTHDG